MKKIRMKTRYADGTRAIEPDQVAELPDAVAKELITKGFAVPVDQDPAHGGKPAKRPARRGPKQAGPADGSGEANPNPNPDPDSDPGAGEGQSADEGQGEGE